jgi:lysozyme
MMEYSKDGLKLTERFEGCRLEAYPDPGTGGDPWTIGYGHTGPDVFSTLVITQEYAERLLLEDVQKAVDNVNAKLQIEVSQGEFDSLVDFAFNCGCRNLNNSTLLKKVNEGDHEAAAEEFLKWDKAGGHVMAGLLKRRQTEAALFLSDLSK